MFESFLFAFNSLIMNKLRTFLSLLGITIGIFAIISVFTVIDSLENSVRNSIESLGNNMVYVQKWPWTFGADYPWWKYLNRPIPKIDEAEEIKRRSKLAEAVTFAVGTKKTVQYKNNSIEGITIFAATQSYENIRVFEIEHGRYFSPMESANGKNKAVIGSEIAKQLFRGINPVGKEIKLMGRKLTVIGVFKKEGSDLFENSTDEEVHIPINFARTILDIRNERLNPLIMVKAKAQISNDDLIDELTGIMRSIRRLKPSVEDNFALNRSSLLSDGFAGMFVVINVAGLIIGGFSIIVGGFGIANIMFVSVKEQTRLIGIQKALGAKRFFILLQFLYESIMLSLMGGILGLLLVFTLMTIASMAADMDFGLSLSNVILGLSISVSIGIISGFVPAYSAARLNAVDAINHT